MEYPIGELIDRLSILYRKKQYDKIYEKEYEEIKKELAKKGIAQDLFEAIIILSEMNADIWNNESMIRKGQTGELSLEEIGRRALLNRNFNARRVEAKNKINKWYGEDIVDHKCDYATDNIFETEKDCNCGTVPHYPECKCHPCHEEFKKEGLIK